MIRRDYILRMVAEFLELLSRIQSLKKAQQWQEATQDIGEFCQRLMGMGTGDLVRLSETELLAKIIQGEPTQVVRDKVILLTRLLKEAGDIASQNGQAHEAREYYLKALHLLLYTLADSPGGEWPDLLPRLENLVVVLGESTLPFTTLAALMRHYEVTGQYGRAEDALYRMLELEPLRPGLLEFGMSFYERLRAHSDAALAEGNLPRPELEAGLAELKASSAAGGSAGR